MDNKHKNEEEMEQEKPLSRSMVLACYFVAFILVIAIVYGLAGIIADISAKATGKNINRLDISSWIAILFLLYRLTRIIGDHWRSNPNNEIGTAVTNLPNPFYDPSFVKAPLLIQKRYSDLLTRFKLQKAVLKSSQEAINVFREKLELYETNLRVLLRHSDNANRLLKSYNFLIKENDNEISKKMLRFILAECITVLEKDQSDKSISLFQVNKDEKLEIIESVRINAESIAKRVFMKNEGFAGYIWGKGKAEIVNNIETNDERFNDQGLPATPIGSILGIPLNVDSEILGVLCLQSESQNGFSESSDFRKVEFYARLCTMVLLYDKIVLNNELGGMKSDNA